MSEKQPQVLIFNATGELVAIARSIRSAAELTKVDENDIKLCCENQSSDSGQYVFDTMSSRFCRRNTRRRRSPH